MVLILKSIAFKWKYKLEIDNTPVVVNTYDGSVIHQPFKNGFNMAFKWQQFPPEQKAIFEFGFMKMAKGVSDTNPVYTKLPTRVCKLTDFPENLHAELTVLGIANYICLDTQDVNFKANFNDKVFESMGVLLYACTANCEAGAAEFLWGSSIHIIYVDARFNYDEPKKGIHYSLNSEIYLYLDPQSTETTIFTLRPSEAKVLDGAAKKFYSVKRTK